VLIYSQFAKDNNMQMNAYISQRYLWCRFLSILTLASVKFLYYNILFIGWGMESFIAGEKARSTLYLYVKTVA
jgi:hypothetical protein